MMDDLDSLQDSKAERIARYKAERRRELAERYANLEESSSLYTQRENKRETTDTSELKKTDVSSVLSQYNKDSSALSRQGDRSNSEAKTEATPFSNIFVGHSDENNQVKCSRQHHSLLEVEEAQNPQDDRKADDDAKTGMPAKTSLLKGLENTDISANPKKQAEDSTHSANPQKEHISGKRTVSTR
ncbi:supervillin-like [Sinocyclocheilus grahami]|uniref:supervillin-like n=1 Tax=Sinocyclocheilus grahami TaxID=75366 RepID=UPI0007ACD917|nr:PREDICTED: supervillin-like [Sinocyclocheilus grahami]